MSRAFILSILFILSGSSPDPPPDDYLKEF